MRVVENSELSNYKVLPFDLFLLNAITFQLPRLEENTTRSIFPFMVYKRQNNPKNLIE